MNYRRLGNTGLRVSEFGLGCGNFGSEDERLGRVDAKAAREMVAFSLDRGVNLFDTANYYAGSKSENLLGAALKGRRQEAVISTRVVGMETDLLDDRTLSRSHVIRAAEESLRRLGTDYLDLYSIQDLGQTVPPGQAPPPVEEPLRALEDLVRWGKVRYIGASDFGLGELQVAVAAAESKGWTAFACDQLHYSLVRREAEEALLPFLKSKGIGAVVWSPLAAGFLTGKYRAGRPAPAGTRRSGTGIEFPHFEPELGERIAAALADLAARRGAAPAQLALAWTLRRPEVSSLLLGARDLDQLASNLEGAGLSLDSAETAALDRASRNEAARV